MRQESCYLHTAHLRRVSLPVEHDETADPSYVCLLGTAAVVPHPDGLPHLIEQLGLVSAITFLLDGMKAPMIRDGIARSRQLSSSERFAQG